jgi:hypothetical protein
MNVSETQAETRSIYLGGSVGQLVSGSLWLIAAALGTWDGKAHAIVLLCVGGAGIFPVTQLVLRLSGRPAALSAENPFGALAMQVAFTIPATLPLVGAATMHNVAWFFPACLIVVGAHYLPFIFLYGMPQFGVLAVAMLLSGYGIGYAFPEAFALGGWVGGAELFAFGLLARRFSASTR